MDPQVGGSFIPKQPLVAQKRGGVGGMGLLVLLAILLFIASLIAAGAVFAYQGVLHASIASKDATLAKAEGAFEPNVIEQLARLDARLNRTEDLLQKHVAPSGIFDFLATITLERVQFTDFKYELGSSGGAGISLGGVADSFSTVALQSDQFGSTRLLKDVVFSGVAVGGDGKVSFNVKATIDPSLYLYTSQSASLQATPAQPSTSSTSSPQATP